MIRPVQGTKWFQGDMSFVYSHHAVLEFKDFAGKKISTNDENASKERFKRHKYLKN